MAPGKKAQGGAQKTPKPQMAHGQTPDKPRGPPSLILGPGHGPRPKPQGQPKHLPQDSGEVSSSVKPSPPPPPPPPHTHTTTYTIHIYTNVRLFSWSGDKVGHRPYQRSSTNVAPSLSFVPIHFPPFHYYSTNGDILFM
jgi:hypothetical protein